MAREATDELLRQFPTMTHDEIIVAHEVLLSEDAAGRERWERTAAVELLMAAWKALEESPRQ